MGSSGSDGLLGLRCVDACVLSGGRAGSGVEVTVQVVCVQSSTGVMRDGG